MKDALLTADARRALARLERKHGPLTDKHGSREALERLAAKWGVL